MFRAETREPKVYYSIIQGSFRTQVPENDPKAVRREIDLDDGSKKVKFERVYDYLYGFIEKVEFFDGEYGRQLAITLGSDESGNTHVIQMNLETREAEDFLKKLPNVDLIKDVRFRAFKFTGNEGDDVRGLELMQEDEEGKHKVKVLNFFIDGDKKPINGMPAPEGETGNYSKDDWKIYFLQVRKFLVNYTLEVMAPKIAQAKEDRETRSPKSLEQQERMGYPTAESEGINPDDIPFD